MSWIAWAVTGAIVVILLLWGVAIYNRLVRQRALVKEGFSGITVQWRRRADLIPTLVSTVEGYATHERETLSQVIAHRGSDPFSPLIPHAQLGLARALAAAGDPEGSRRAYALLMDWWQTADPDNAVVAQARREASAP